VMVGAPMVTALLDEEELELPLCINAIAAPAPPARTVAMMIHFRWLLWKLGSFRSPERTLVTETEGSTAEG